MQPARVRPATQTASPPGASPSGPRKAPTSSCGSAMVAVTWPWRWSRRRSRTVESRWRSGSPLPDSSHTRPASAASPYSKPPTPSTGRAGPPPRGTRHSRWCPKATVHSAWGPRASHPTGWRRPEASVTTSGGRGRNLRASTRLTPRNRLLDHSRRTTPLRGLPRPGGQPTGQSPAAVPGRPGRSRWPRACPPRPPPRPRPADPPAHRRWAPPAPGGR